MVTILWDGTAIDVLWEVAISATAFCVADGVNAPQRQRGHRRQIIEFLSFSSVASVSLWFKINPIRVI